MKQKVALINQIRGFCLEYGVLTPQSRHKMITGLSQLIEDSQDRLTSVVTELLKNQQEELRDILERIKSVKKKIGAISKQTEVCQRITSIPGVGLLTATAS